MFRLLFFTFLFLSWAKAEVDLDRGDFGRFGRSLNNRSYGYQVIKDPTLKAPVSQVEHFKVKNGDCGSTKTWSDCQTDRERSELSESQRTNRDEHAYWYGWSIFLPQSYSLIYPAKVCLGQFHQEQGSPLWMFQNSDEGLLLEATFLEDATKFLLVRDKELRGHWIKIEMEVFWSQTRKGYLRVWVNDILKVDYKGPTKQDSKVYFKYGLYRSFLERYKKQYKSHQVPEQEVFYANVKRALNRKGLLP